MCLSSLNRKRDERRNTESELSLFSAVIANDLNRVNQLLNHVSPDVTILDEKSLELLFPERRISLELRIFFNVKNRRTKIFGQTPLHFARSAKMANLLISKGAEVDAVDTINATPLFYVIFHVYHFSTIIELLRSGADPNVQIYITGDTPLHLAMKQMRVRRLKMLVNAGALVSIKNKNGLTPLDLARKELDEVDDMDVDIQDHMREFIEPTVNYLENVMIRILIRKNVIAERSNPLGINLISKSLHEMMG